MTEEIEIPTTPTPNDPITIPIESLTSILTQNNKPSSPVSLQAPREIVLPNFANSQGLSLTADLIREASENTIKNENIENLGNNVMESNAQGRPLSHKCPKCPYRSAWRSCVLTHMKLKHSSM